MRTTTPHIVILLLSQMMLFGCSAAPVQTNQLAYLLTTNRAGQYHLEPPWVGECRTTMMTGSLAAGTWDSQLRFDLFALSDKPEALGSRGIGRASAGAMSHIYQATFPSDAELKEAHTVPELRKLLGAAHGPVNTWGILQVQHSHASWSYFRLSDNATLETLTVKCLTTRTNGQEWHVDSIRIRRGIAKPMRRRQVTARSRLGFIPESTAEP